MTKQQQNLIVNLRQKLHQCPEISGQEARTKALLQEFLRAHTSLEILPCGEGFYAAHREQATEKPAIALRADYDALATPDGGAAHLCGHDGHAASLCAVALALEGKPARAAASFALSLAFKLQAVFILPIVVVLWVDRKLRLSDALVFLGTLVLTALPALLGGKSIGALLSIYTAQTGLYTGLTYNAPNFFALMNTTGLDVYAYGNFGMALAFGVCALLVSAGVKRAGRMTRAGYLRLALLLPLAIVFFLPRMHERYFYLADILSVALAAYDKKAAPVCALAVFASFSCYWETLFSLPVCALMMLAALILTLRHTQRDENVI